MPKYGEKKEIVIKMSAQEMEEEFNVISSPITHTLVKAAAWALGGAFAYKAKNVFVAVIAGGAASVQSDISDYILDLRADELESYLKKVKAENANGIKLESTYQYRYMSGSGTAWYRVSAVKISTY
jgi:hypothetical protein